MTSKPLIFLGIVIVIIASLAGTGYILNKDGKFSDPAVDNNSAIQEVLANQASSSATVIKPYSDIAYPASSTVDTASWQIYIDKEQGYSLEYPSNLIRSVNAGILSLVFPKNTYFHWPLLDDVRVNVSVSTSCPAVLGGGEGVETNKFTLKNYNFTRSVSTDVGAGQRYLEVAYDTKYKGFCFHISLLDHGTNGAGFYVDDASFIAKYDAQHKEDLEKTIDILGGIVKTFKILAQG